MRAFNTLLEQGKTRFVGVSNFEADGMMDAASYLQNARLACNQVLYHLSQRGIEHELIPVARRQEIAIVGYTPFGRGAFLQAGARRRESLERVAGKHGATVRQVALAFLSREPELFVIPKASRVEHVEENAAAGELELDADDVAEIDQSFTRGEPGPLEML
jgi:diketogulonate reductase-like aldo/keto reductase